MFLLIYKGFFAFSKNLTSTRVSDGHKSNIILNALPVPKIDELGLVWNLSPYATFNNYTEETKKQNHGQYQKKQTAKQSYSHNCSFIKFNSLYLTVFQAPMPDSPEILTYNHEIQYQYDDLLSSDCTMFFCDEPMLDEDVQWMLFKNKPLPEILERLSFSMTVTPKSPMSCFWLFEKDSGILPNSDYPEHFYSLVTECGTCKGKRENRQKIADYLGYEKCLISANNK